MPNKSESQPMMDDPLVTNSLHEAKWILVVWVGAFAWVIGYSSQYGYVGEGDSLATVLGMPAWVFWGVAFPWGVATVITSWFALRCIVDEPLVDSAEAQRDDDE